MMSVHDTWGSRLLLWLLLLVLGGVWLYQAVSWGAWEWGRSVVPDANRDTGSEPPDPVSIFAAPPSPDLPGGLAGCPFSLQNPELLGRYFDYSDWMFGERAYPHDEPPFSSLFSSPAEIPDPDPFETPASILAERLRYRGLLERSDGVRIAFLERVESAQTLRLRIGDRVEDGTLRVIDRNHVSFELAGGGRVEVPRRAVDPPLSSEIGGAPDPSVDPDPDEDPPPPEEEPAAMEVVEDPVEASEEPGDS